MPPVTLKELGEFSDVEPEMHVVEPTEASSPNDQSPEDTVAMSISVNADGSLNQEVAQMDGSDARKMIDAATVPEDETKTEEEKPDLATLNAEELKSLQEKAQFADSVNQAFANNAPKLLADFVKRLSPEEQAAFAAQAGIQQQQVQQQQSQVQQVQQQAQAGTLPPALLLALDRAPTPEELAQMTPEEVYVRSQKANIDQIPALLQGHRDIVETMKNEFGAHVDVIRNLVIDQKLLQAKLDATMKAGKVNFGTVSREDILKAANNGKTLDAAMDEMLKPEIEKSLAAIEQNKVEKPDTPGTAQAAIKREFKGKQAFQQIFREISGVR